MLEKDFSYNVVNYPIKIKTSDSFFFLSRLFEKLNVLSYELNIKIFIFNKYFIKKNWRYSV